MSSLKRISLRTPHPHGACKNLLRGLVYEHLDPPQRKHATSSQFPRRTRHQSHNGSKSHTLSYIRTHTSHIRPPTYETHTHKSERICMHSRRTYIPSSHRRTHNTAFPFRPAFEVFMLTKECCRRQFFAFRGSGRKGTGGFCMHSRRTDIHIPSSHRRRFQKYYVSNPLFLIISTCNIEVNACNNTYPHEDE